MEDVKNYPFSVVGCSDVDLSFRGCSANLQRRLQGSRNRRYENKSGSVAGSCSVNGDSRCHEFPLPSAELSFESLGKHHRGYCLFWFQSHWIAWIPFSLRQIPDNCRTW